MPSVLVVDDDSAIRTMLSEVLKAEGYSVQTAAHGGPALTSCVPAQNTCWSR